MSLMSSRQIAPRAWKEGDLMTAAEACKLLGYKSPMQLRDANRRAALIKEFEILRVPFTDGIWIGGQRRYLRFEFQAFIDAKVAAAQSHQTDLRKNLRRLW